MSTQSLYDVAESYEKVKRDSDAIYNAFMNKDPTELTMEEALILIEKRKEYDKTKKRKRK